MADDEPDYTFVEDDPPTPGGELARNMVLTANAPRTWCRLATYKNRSTADSIASNLRTGKRNPDRPPGTWQFHSEEVENGRYAVKALYTPST